MSYRSFFHGDLRCLLKNYASGAAKNKTLEQKRFFSLARMTSSRSLLVIDGALKLGYARVIFVDPEVHIDENFILLPQLLCVIREVSGSSHLSPHKTLVYSTRVSQGSVATRLRRGGIFNDSFIANFPPSVPIKEF